jgi:hypothetical protein
MARASRRCRGCRPRAAGTGGCGRDLRTGGRARGSPPALRRGRPGCCRRVRGVAGCEAGHQRLRTRGGRGLTLTRSGLGAAAGAVSSGGSAAKRLGPRDRGAQAAPSALASRARRREACPGFPATAGREPRAGAPAATFARAPLRRGARDWGAHHRSRAAGKVDRGLCHRVATLCGGGGGARHGPCLGHLDPAHDTMQRIIGIGHDHDAAKGRHHGGERRPSHDGVYGLNANSEHAPDPRPGRAITVPLLIKSAIRAGC